MMICYLLHQPYLPEEWNVPATADVAQQQLRTVLEKMNATRGLSPLVLGWAAVFFWLESLHFDMLMDNPHLVEDVLRLVICVRTRRTSMAQAVAQVPNFLVCNNALAY